MKNILVLGGNGFIGKHLVIQLLQNPENHVFVVARNKTEEIASNKISYIYSDFKDLKNHTPIFKTMDCVYHLISQSYPFTTWENPIEEVKLNLIPTLEFLDSIAGYVPKIIFVSSGGTIYGKHSQISSETSIPKPNNPHGIIKLCIENFLLYYQTKYKMDFLVFRVSNVYGPGQITKKGLGVINTIAEKVLHHEEITIYGSGEQNRDFIYVEDVAQILVAANEISEWNKTYNLSFGKSHSLNEILKHIEKHLKVKLTIKRLEAREFDLKNISIDNSCLVKDFDISNFVTLEEGIVHTLNSIQS
jgi:UDP-glucose 4-epimerase